MRYLHPIMTPVAAAEFEKQLLYRRDFEWAAMQRAGRALGRAILADLPEVRPGPRRLRVLLLIGKGHNGGDALLAGAEILRRAPDAEVFTLTLTDRRDWRSMTNDAAKVLDETGKWSEMNLGELTGSAFDVVVDGLLGMKFRPPVREEVRDVLEVVNAHPEIAFRVAVDLPSGLGDDAAFRADTTYATGIVKTPVVDPTNGDKVGRLRYLDLGFFENRAPAEQDAPSPAVVTTSVLEPLRQLRAALPDKRHYGHLFIVAGSGTMPGALLMNAEAAVRSGVGLVTVFAPESVTASFAARVPEAMWVPMPETPSRGLALEGRRLVTTRLPRATALLCGSGMGEDPETLALLKELLSQRAAPAVLDADALRPEVVAAVVRSEGPATILTPHLGEFRRIAAKGPEATDDGLRSFALTHAVTLLLKGSITRVTDGQRLACSVEGGPVLARGGSGDVLAGLLGGLLAQSPGEPFAATCRAAFWHARAAVILARVHGATAVRTTDLFAFLAPALREGG